jgi:hypothetical protein
LSLIIQRAKRKKYMLISALGRQFHLIGLSRSHILWIWIIQMEDLKKRFFEGGEKKGRKASERNNAIVRASPATSPARPPAPFFYPDGEKWPSRAPDSSFSPGFGPSSIRWAQAIPGPSGHARGLRTREKRERARSVGERTRKPYNLVANPPLPPPRCSVAAGTTPRQSVGRLPKLHRLFSHQPPPAYIPPSGVPSGYIPPSGNSSRHASSTRPAGVRPFSWPNMDSDDEEALPENCLCPSRLWLLFHMQVRLHRHVIRLKRIYNFLCSMLVLTPFA